MYEPTVKHRVLLTSVAQTNDGPSRQPAIAMTTEIIEYATAQQAATAASLLDTGFDPMTRVSRFAKVLPKGDER